LSVSGVTGFIRTWGKKLGAAGVGFTEMADYHYYTTAGRGDRYGNSIRKRHKFGIVFLVEMDQQMISSAPRSPVVMESANQYLRSAAIATQVAVMIRRLGYKAKTHIDANYDVICPLVAKDAGLGEIGRNGLLISDDYGPRVRISVVTTDLPLMADRPRSDSSVIKFCSVCKKCAYNCPAQSISTGPRELVNNVMKWQLDQESCFTYWNHCGTDCGKCISTCPYSHGNNWFHNTIRAGIRNNIFFLHLASLLDDFFYGKRPSSGNMPDLMP
jgi:reductive dehalogenase